MILNSNINDVILSAIDISKYTVDKTYISKINRQRVVLKAQIEYLPVCLNQQICDVFKCYVDNIKIDVNGERCDFLSRNTCSYFRGINSIDSKNFSFVLCKGTERHKIYDLCTNSDTFQVLNLDPGHYTKLELINCDIKTDTLILNRDHTKISLNNSNLAPQYIVFDYNPHIYLEKGVTNNIEQIINELNLNYINPENLKSIFIPIETKKSGIKLCLITNWYSQFVSYMNKKFRQYEGMPNTYIIDTVLYYNWWSKEIHFKYDTKQQY